MLSDREVGELWAWCQDEQPIAGKDKLVDAMRGLIRKLVEDGAELAYRRQGGKWSFVALTDKEQAHWRNVKLRDFGIDPALYATAQAEGKREG